VRFSVIVATLILDLLLYVKFQESKKLLEDRSENMSGSWSTGGVIEQVVQGSESQNPAKV
jgi:hypothetical protein